MSEHAAAFRRWFGQRLPQTLKPSKTLPPPQHKPNSAHTPSRTGPEPHLGTPYDWACGVRLTRKLQFLALAGGRTVILSVPGKCRFTTFAASRLFSGICKTAPNIIIVSLLTPKTQYGKRRACTSMLSSRVLLYMEVKGPFSGSMLGYFRRSERMFSFTWKCRLETGLAKNLGLFWK